MDQKGQKSQNGFADHPSPTSEAANPFSQYLAPLGAKSIEKKAKEYAKIAFLGPFPVKSPAVKKLAASAASLAGFSSRDPVAC